MSDTAEYWQFIKAERAREGAARRALAAEQFREARLAAWSCGLSLVRHTESHYSLRCEGWQIDLYPGNRRLFAARGKPPFLHVPPDWTLADVVDAAARAIGAEQNLELGGESSLSQF